MPLQKSGILPLPYVFYPPIFGSSERPIKAGSDELSPIRIKWLKSQVFWVLVHPSKKVELKIVVNCSNPTSMPITSTPINISVIQKY